MLPTPPQIDGYNYFVLKKLKTILEKFCIRFAPPPMFAVSTESKSLHAKKSKVLVARQAAATTTQAVEIRLCEFQIHKSPKWHLTGEENGGKRGGRDQNDFKMYLDDVKNLKMSYCITVRASVTVSPVDQATPQQPVLLKIPDVDLFDFPVMAGSNYCNSYSRTSPEEEPGGFYIIDGLKKIIMPQERVVINTPLKIADNKVIMYCRNEPKYHYATLFELEMKDRVIYWVSNKELVNGCVGIPIAMVLSILRRTPSPDDDQDVYAYYSQYFTSREMDYFGESLFFHVPPEDALKYICARLISAKEVESLPSKTKFDFVRQELRNHFLNHCETSEQKFELLILLIKDLLSKPTLDSLDDLANKSYATSGVLFNELVSSVMQAYQSVCLKKFLKQYETVDKLLVNLKQQIFRDNYVTARILTAMRTGNWGSTKGSINNPTGIVQQVNQSSFLSYFILTRRVVNPMSNKSKNPDPRAVCATQPGFICPLETTDGENVGLTKSLGISVEFSKYSLPLLLLEAPSPGAASKPILMNGIVVGRTTNEQEFVSKFKQKRSIGDIEKDVSIVCTTHYILIKSSEGRLVRPLGCVTTKKIEWLDPSEAIQQRIYMPGCGLSFRATDYTHFELDVCNLYGIGANLIPFSNHNKAARITFYSASMCKQAIGRPSMDVTNNFDNAFQVLSYPQKPLSKTKYFDSIIGEDKTNTFVPIVALLVWSGYNQEDSILYCRSSIDRGLGRVTIYKTYTAILPSDYTPNVETPEIALGSYCPEIGRMMRKDKLLIVPSTYVVTEGYVDRARICKVSGGSKIQIQVRIRTPHSPEVGDKFSSEHAQKGTISKIIPDEDMPRTADGIRPDIVINTHAIISRDAHGHEVGHITSKVAAFDGKIKNATAFQPRNLHDLMNYLKYQCHGKDYERLYSGTTGEMLAYDKITMGPISYNVLKHFVHAKQFSRTDGPVDEITKQPVSGKAHGGGIRFGGMEKDVVVAYNAGEFLRDRMMYCSNVCERTFCLKCGGENAYDRSKTVPGEVATQCVCGAILQGSNNNAVHKVEMPYSSKLTQTTVNALNIDVKYKF